MAHSLTLYLDLCCLNRPFDDQSQDRIRLETEALSLIQWHIDSGEWRWVSSGALEAEGAQNPNLEKRVWVQAILARASERIPFSALNEVRLREVEKMGFKPFDAAHLVSAEVAKVDALLTTDDAFRKRAQRLASEISARVENPVDWLQERTMK